jgi:hypothetical protein
LNVKISPSGTWKPATQGGFGFVNSRSCGYSRQEDWKTVGPIEANPKTISEVMSPSTPLSVEPAARVCIPLARIALDIDGLFPQWLGKGTERHLIASR